MGLFRQNRADELLYSCIYGRGLYRDTGEMVQDLLDADNRQGFLSPILENVLTGEQFYIRRIPGTEIKRDQYAKRIMRSPNQKHILWPVDLVELTDETECSLLVSQQYTDSPEPVETVGPGFGLLFPLIEYPHTVDGAKRLEQIGILTWKNPELRKIALRIVQAFDAINKSGYVYQDIHLSRFRFTENDRVIFDFSRLAMPMEDVFSGSAEALCAVNSGEYPIEFADPSVYCGSRRFPDFESQNYSLTALLFYLLIGLYPYDGRLLTGYRDDSLLFHYIKFRDYIKMPIFIFDPDDARNTLSEQTFAEKADVIELWQDLPDEIKSVFISTLRQANAERTVQTNNPTPAAWIALFQKVGWVDKPEAAK